MKYFSKQSGAFLVELALTLPIFLSVVLFIIWFSIYSNTRSALTSAVVNAPMTARARARSEYQLIPPIDNFILNGTFSTQLDGILYQGIPHTDVSYANTMRFENDDTLTSCPYTSIDTPGVPTAYAYTLAYVISEFRSSIGNTFKFPCDPEGNGPYDGDGCLQCYFLEPDSLPQTQYPLGWDCSTPLRDRFVLVCKYQPENKFFTLMSRLLGVVTGNPKLGIVERTMAL